MSSETCARCGRTIHSHDAAFHVWLWVVARVNEDIAPSSEADWRQAVAQASERLAAVPEDEIASEVYARRSYLVCSRCKDHVVEAPFG
jgi:hypothetical protein